MDLSRENLTPTEAAIVAQVSVRDINRIIDEQILPENFLQPSHGRLRQIKASACGFIAFYFRTADRLTAEERLRIIQDLNRRMSIRSGETDWVVKDDFLIVNVGPFIQGARERAVRLAAARSLVVVDPEILNGTPVIRGTRIPVYDVAASVAIGLPMKRILAAYSQLNSEAVELAALYAEANPLRGRPRRSVFPPSGAVIVSAERKARRKRTA